MIIRAAMIFVLLAQSVATGPRTPKSEDPTFGRREMERAQDQLAARRDFNKPPNRLTSRRLLDAIHDFQASDDRVAPMHITYGEFVTVSGHYFVAMHFDATVPANVEKATLFGVVDDWSIEEQVTLKRAPDGIAFYERSFVLPAGTHNATFGFAVKGEPVAMASTPMVLRELNKATRGVSRLLVSSQVFNLDKPQAADEPFAFGGMKVIPKADRTFHRGEELWIFFEAQNPGVDDAGAPNLTTMVKIEGNGKTRRGLAGDAPPVALKGVPGHFGVGTTIDTSTLAPGEYLVHVLVADAIAQQKYELTEKIAIIE